MIYEETMKAGIDDVEKNGFITNRTILRILENIGGYHSDKVGYGLLDIERNGVTWILLDWKVKVIKRPMYGETLLVKTWGRDAKKVTVGRDYEIYNENNELCVIGTSKWALIDIKTKKVTKITQDVIDSYELDERTAFDEPNIEKVQIPEQFTSTYTFETARRDIDVNGHMHNIHYLEIAHDALPKEAYEQRPYNNVRIDYKKEIKLGDIITCHYAYHDGKHVVVFKNGETTNCIVELWN